MQIKTTMRYHRTAVRMAIINKSTNKKCWQRCGGRGTFIHCWWGCKLVQPLWKTVWRFLKNLRIELPYDPTIPLLDVYPPKLKTFTCKDVCTPVFIAAWFSIAKTWQQPKWPRTDGWIKMMWYVYTVEYYSDIKNDEIMLFQWMDLQSVMLREISHKEKDMNPMISLRRDLKQSNKWTNKTSS